MPDTLNVFAIWDAVREEAAPAVAAMSVQGELIVHLVCDGMEFARPISRERLEAEPDPVAYVRSVVADIKGEHLRIIHAADAGAR